MLTAAKPLFLPFQLAHLRLPHLFGADRRRRRATMDLIHSSPHLLRDIGLGEDSIRCRGR